MSSKISGTIAARVPNEVKASIENVLDISHSKMRDVMIDFSHKLETGEISLSNGRIILPEPVEAEVNLDMSNFIEACESKGVKPQDALNKAAQMVWRG